MFSVKNSTLMNPMNVITATMIKTHHMHQRQVPKDQDRKSTTELSIWSMIATAEFTASFGNG